MIHGFLKFWVLEFLNYHIKKSSRFYNNWSQEILKEKRKENVPLLFIKKENIFSVYDSRVLEFGIRKKSLWVFVIIKPRKEERNEGRSAKRTLNHKNCKKDTKKSKPKNLLKKKWWEQPRLSEMVIARADKENKTGKKKKKAPKS